MEKRKIKLARGAKTGPENQPIYGWHEVDAYCKGGLAVHKALKGDRWKWTVTHEASGLALTWIGANTKSDTVANMEKALALNFDWTRGEAETIAALRESRDIVDAFRKIGERH